MFLHFVKIFGGGRGGAIFFPVLGIFWLNVGPGVGGNDSSDRFHPQCSCPEVGGPKPEHLKAISGFGAPLKSRLPLKVDRQGNPCRIRSTFKGGCVLSFWGRAQTGYSRPEMAPKWSDLGPPTSGQVHWG